MDQQKMDSVGNPAFPLVEAIITQPEEGREGSIGICSNTTAPGQVLNELDLDLRKHVSVIGSLIVSRDGGERMIVNSLAHPSLRYLVLFSEESVTFAPATNLLLAVMDGFDETKIGNYIKEGIAASSHYPSLNRNILDQFRRNITVIPAFMPKHEKSKETIVRYLEWLKPRIHPELHELLVAVNGKEKIYYDSLKKIITLVAAEPTADKSAVTLDPKDFQHLQPPKIELAPSLATLAVPFKIIPDGRVMRLDIRIGTKSYTVESDDPFIMAYSLMKRIGEDKKMLAPIDQLLLGAELGRISTETVNDIAFPPFALHSNVMGTEAVPLESNLKLVMDSRYYYKVNAQNGKISVMCLAFDVCESVFELVSPDLTSVAERLARENRFEQYDMDILHRIDIGIQLGRAAIAAKLGYSFIQDFSAIFKINKERLPTVIVDSDSFLDAHKGVLRRIYTEGITEEHGDPWKGLARTACVLAIYRNAPEALKDMPALYRQGDQDPAMVRANYREQLLRLDHDGTYTYGQRTRSYFGFDQLERTIETLQTNPTQAAVIQRFDPATDMSEYVDADTGKTKFTHDPCLTHDIFFIKDGKLNSFHIARAHNTVNAYPENVYGLFDAYVTTVSHGTGIPAGDMYMLSSRGNILLLTEEQRTKKVLGEPSKPVGKIDVTSGPYSLSEGSRLPDTEGGVAYCVMPLVREPKRPEHPALDRLEDYESVDTVAKAIDYLASKGSMHNNVTLSEYYAGKSDPQADQLAFFQINAFGKKVYVTAVFMNRSVSKKQDDATMANHIATRLADKLSIALGNLSLFYVGYTI